MKTLRNLSIAALLLIALPGCLPVLVGGIIASNVSADNRAAEAKQAEADRVQRASLAAKVCVLGASQACIGPGACHGGQTCIAGGTAFSSCDCGPVSSPVQAPFPVAPIID